MVITILGATGNESGSVTIVDWNLAAKNRISRIVFADGSVLKTAEIEILVNNPPTLFYGTNNNDTLRTSSKSGPTVIVYGFGGQDTIYGRHGADVFVPGSGINIIYARAEISNEGGGQKTFVWNVGDGHTTVFYSNAARSVGDRLAALRLGVNISPENISVLNSGYDVIFVINLGGSEAGRMIFKEANRGNIRFQPDEVQFADGTIWKWSDVVNRKIILGTEGNDTIYTRGIAGEKITIYGLGGNDILNGGAADETFVPGSGINIIYTRAEMPAEGGGQKTFVLNAADNGHTTVFYSNTARSVGDRLAVLRFGVNVSHENISVRNSGYDVIFVVNIEGNDVVSMTFKEANRANIRYQPDEVQFADGTVWSWSDVVNRKIVLGTEGNDTIYTRGIAGEKITIYGLGGNDIFYCGAADETFVPGSGINTIYARAEVSNEGGGQKTFVWNVGDGHTTVFYSNTARSVGDSLAVLKFGANVSHENISVRNSGYDVIFVVNLEGNDVGSMTFKEANRANIRYQPDEVQFACGTVWNWATMPR
jgi:Ca2+-binding RTX toxin-like protein